MQFQRLTLLCLFTILSIFASSQQSSPATGSRQPGLSDTELAQKLDAYLSGLRDKDEFSGAVLVAKGDQHVFEKCYGQASKEYNVLNNVETKFNLGSIDKLFTKIAIGQLITQGKLSLDDKLGKYLTAYPNKEAGEKVTIRHLVNMQSGIGDFFGPKFMESPKDHFRSIADYLPLFASEPLQFEPGSKRKYSNGGYLVLGAIIEKISGKSYYDYIQENITKPLGMKDTDFYEADVPTPNLASGYTRFPKENGPRANNMYTRPARGSSAGGGYSTLRDLLKFSLALKSGQIINPDFSGELPKPPNAPFASIRGVGVAGGAPGINADLETDLPGGYTVIVLSNYDPPSSEAVAKQIRQWLGVSDD